MNFIDKLVLLLFCCLISIQALAIQSDSGNNDLVDVMLHCALLNEAGNVSVNVYCIDSPKALPLPIYQSTIKNLTYVEYSTTTSNRTAHPLWNLFMQFSSSLFNLNSYLAFELWNQTAPGVKEYVGGSILTVEQLEQRPSIAPLYLNDLKHNIVGTVLISWSV